MPRMIRIHAVLCMALLPLGNPTPLLADHDELPSFGYRELGSGSMPLLTILLDFDEGNFSPGHDTEFYSRLLFLDGGLRGTLAGPGSFYAEQSTGEFGLGAFTFENAGVIGPFFHPDDPLTPGNEQNFACARGMDTMGNPTPPARPPGRTLPIAPCGYWRWNTGEVPPEALPGWDDLSLHETLTNAIIAADLAGFPFGDFDTNRDGIVNQHELAILVIYAPPAPFSTGAARDFSAGGAVRNSSEAPFVEGRSGLRVHLPVATVGENASASTIAHELAHLLQKRVGDGYEGYGSNDRCLNQNFTSMSCTIFPGVDDRRIFHLDPYTKLRFGFLQPEIAHLDDFLCLAMQPIEDEPGPDTRSLILYDSDRGPGEYFILEYRRPLLFNYDGDPFTTGSFGLPDKGLGIWYVQVDEKGGPVSILALDGTGGKDAALLLVPPGFADDPSNWGWPSANNGLWGPEDGAAMLFWPDGTSTGTELRVLRDQSSTLFLQVSTTGGPTCLNVPKPTLTEFLRIDQGIDHWDNGLLSVTRSMGTPIVSGKQFVVEYTLIANQDIDGPVVVSDNFQGDFLPIPGQKPSLTFPPLTQGQPVSLSYSMLAGEADGGFELSTELVLDPDTQESYEIRSFISVWNPTKLVFGESEENDADGDDVSDSGDKCPAENAYGFDSDRNGCIDNLADIAGVIDGLSTNGVIKPGLSNSLLKKITNAGKAASRRDYSAAAGMLQGFLGEVKALEVKKIPEYEAFLLRSFAETIQSHFVSLAANDN